jgi:hypothetical protein
MVLDVKGIGQKFINVRFLGYGSLSLAHTLQNMHATEREHRPLVLR